MATKTNGNNELKVTMKFSKSTPKGNHAIYANADSNDLRITSLYVLKSAFSDDPPASVEVTVKGVT